VANSRAAEQAGRLALEMRFGPWKAGSFAEGTARVYTFDVGAAVAPAPRPEGAVIPSGKLQLRTKEGDAAPAFDGRLNTSYILERPLRGDEFIEARFESARAVSGVEVVLRHESAWPTRFRIAVLREDGQWVEAARFDGPHLVQLVDALQRDPRGASIGFVLNGEKVLGVSLLPQIGATSAAGWNLPELRILEKP
jgi:hypothetical protein